MDWILAAFKDLGVHETTFVGGYRIEDVGAQYPDLQYIYNPEWETSGVLESFYHARQEMNGNLLVSYADIVYGPSVCENVVRGADDGIAIAIDRGWAATPADHPRRDGLRKNLVVTEGDYVTDIGFLDSSGDAAGEFIGLTFFSQAAMPVINAFFDEHYPALVGKPFQQATDVRKGFLTDLLRYLLEQGVSIRAVDIGSDWAEMEDASRFARFVLSTKSDTLTRLAYLVKGGRFCEQEVVTVREWKAFPSRIVASLQERFGDKAIVVRSSALVEDSWTASQAGAFDSILNVDASSAVAVELAINKVISSYDKYETSAHDDNQVLVQEQVQNVAMSGVVFTRDIESGAPYYVINYDDQTATTDTVTQGTSRHIKTAIVSRASAGHLENENLAKLLSVVQEVEQVTGCRALDIEFAVTQEGGVYILQTRPIATQAGADPFGEIEIEKELERLSGFLEERFKPMPGLLGRTTILADMPDWNPAEMIGTHPRPLALSLYDYLITKDAWRRARGSIGYRDPAPAVLMVSAGGHPYIDVRCSFNNLLPADLDDALSEKLVNHYLDELAADPSKHDKVEFEICFTCLDFQFDKASERLERSGFSPQEIETLSASLLRLTDRAVRGQVCPFSELQASLDTLRERTEMAVANVTTPDARLRAIGTMLDDCVEFGTIPFSILARYAFIANSLLKSLVVEKVFSEERQYAFLNSIETVATELVRDMGQVTAGTSTVECFLEKYGHLRPGTYEVTSLRYDEAPDMYFSASLSDQPGASSTSPCTDDKPSTEWSAAERSAIDALITKHGFNFSTDEMFTFIRKAIALREFGKFQFTRTVSEILRQLYVLGQDVGLTRDELSFVPIEFFRKSSWCVEPYHFADQLKHAVQAGRGSFQASRLIKLPHFLSSLDDLYAFELPSSRPNFITMKRVTSPTLMLVANTDLEKLTDSIVLIEGADPGYDWIFAHRIAGLVTKYGGAASHMTIRAAEFGIPAAIGCGESLFEALSRAKMIELNCASRRIHAL
jgi:glutamine kinase